MIYGMENYCSASLTKMVWREMVYMKIVKIRNPFRIHRNPKKNSGI